MDPRGPGATHRRKLASKAPASSRLPGALSRVPSQRSIPRRKTPSGWRGGLNLYGYAGGDPINYADPFGLCAQAADSVLVDVTQCMNGQEVAGKAWAVWYNTPEGNASLQEAVGTMSFSGSSPEGASALSWLKNQTTGYYVIRGTSTAGNPVLTAGGYQSGFLLLREDVAGMLESGGMNEMVPVPNGRSNTRVCTVLGHEGLHGGAGLGHPGDNRAINRIQQGFRCRQ